jgi:mannose-6-phosphate isomerase-like protein (cupin superfamily)
MAGNKAFMLARDQDRFGAPIGFLNGRFDLKLASADTDGALCLIDTVRTGRGGPPLHRHFEQDEMFLVLDGQFSFQIGTDVFEAGPGDFVFAPRLLPHAFANRSETGRLLVMFQPAGTMEAFFAAGPLDPTSEAFRERSRAHGMEVVGPPLQL